MASVSLTAVRIPASVSQLVTGSHPSSSFSFPKVTTKAKSSFSFRFKNTVRSPQTRQRLFSAFASNSNPSGGDSLQEKSDGTKTSDAGQGPPFLTVLAGLLVFLLFCWIVFSIIMWLISFFVQSPPK